VTYCQSPEAQAIFVAHGARGLGDATASSGLFAVADLGGWKTLKAEVFAKGGAYDRALATARAKRDAR
jgi:ABC-type sulfate transport system substrate-binding protein